jgi:cold shock protein
MSSQVPDQLTNAEGVVKWFDPRKGFGFTVASDGRDVFIHYTVIQGEGFRVLKDGSKVIFDAVRTDRGWKATRVIRDDTLDIQVPKRDHTRSPRR